MTPPPSPTPDIGQPDDEPTPIELDPPRWDNRWICYLCGDLSLLDSSGKCRNCQPERVLTLSEVAARAVCGERVEIRRRWRIG